MTTAISSMISNYQFWYHHKWSLFLCNFVMKITWGFPYWLKCKSESLSCHLINTQFIFKEPPAATVTHKFSLVFEEIQSVVLFIFLQK